MIASTCGHPGTTLKYRPGQIIGGSGLVGDPDLTNLLKVDTSMVEWLTVGVILQ